MAYRNAVLSARLLLESINYITDVPFTRYSFETSSSNTTSARGVVMFICRQSILIPLSLFLSMFIIPGLASPPTEIAPVAMRVILLLDRSGSMCESNLSSQCCTMGDGSGLCMQNDPTDKRIAAANLLVDSLSARSIKSEIGVITFSTDIQSHIPLELSSELNTNQLHSWIEGAGCIATKQILTKLSTTTKAKITNLGTAVQAGLAMADTNHSVNVSRHIILLTDGAWDDAANLSPQSLVTTYHLSFPDRIIPQIHGVFLSDSLLHVMHDYPSEGCSGTDPVGLEHLHNITQLTNGTYIPNATPQSIVNDLLSLLDNVTGVATPPPDINGSNYHSQPEAVFTIHTRFDNRSIECSLHLQQSDHVDRKSVV